MAEIPHAVLSEYFQELMKGRRLHSAVFLTYQYDPGFFEQEILPVFFDISLSHASVIRLVQLEDAIRTLPGQVAVYYDANGIVISDAGSAKLDTLRIPVQHHTGIFHPKNILLLVDDEHVDEQDNHPQSLIIASMSANLTRSGWWENIEACYVEEVKKGDKTRIKDDLTKFLKLLLRKVSAENEHLALSHIIRFLKESTAQHVRKTKKGQLHTHFYAGGLSIADFLEQTAEKHLMNAYLEIISPYFDNDSH